MNWKEFVQTPVNQISKEQEAKRRRAFKPACSPTYFKGQSATLTKMVSG